MRFSKCFLPALALLFSVPLIAQNGSAEGYVNDPNGKGIQGAVVSFDQADLHYHAETKTDKKGRFIFLSLLHGEYRITVKVDGKVRDTRDHYLVSAGQQDGSGEMSSIVFKLKPIEAFKAEQQKEGEKDAKREDVVKLAAAREEQLTKQLSRNSDYVAGKTAFDAKQYDTAIDDLAKATVADPRQALIWSLLADACLAAAHQRVAADAAPLYQKAYEAYGKVIEIEPDNAGNYNNFALALAANGRMDEARQRLAKAIELDPEGAWTYHYNLAALLMNTSHLDDAVEEFRKTSEAKPDFADAYYYLGSTLAGKVVADARGNMIAPAGALEALRKYLALKPDGPFAGATKELLAALGLQPGK